ncbi:hypothetical protein FRB94_009186 [Tulasnella sp. JGI-2019a]|nr:hypothetical protein FRB94_009186 [Tulasnella sp. JGI-2019a]
MPTDSNTFFTGPRGLDHQPEHKINTSIGLAIGLNSLDVNCDRNVRVMAYADNQAGSSATIRIASWDDTVLDSGGCTWLEVAKNNHDFQYGVFNTADDRSWTQPKMETSCEISFEKAFAEPPKIVCWLNMIDMDHKHNCRIAVGVKNVTKTGFNLCITTWHDSILYTASATWIAYPANRNNITSGYYSTGDVRHWSDPQPRCERDILFDRTFQKALLVLTALNMMDIDHCSSSIRIKTLSTNVTAEGMTWHLDTWALPRAERFTAVAG